MGIEIYAPQRKVRGFDLAGLRTRILALETAANVQDREVCVTLVSNQKIRILNREYRQKDAATDVLSFAQNEGEMAYINPHVLGDIVVSVERAQEQYIGVHPAGRPVHSTDEDWSLLDEVTHLVIHGLLHLMGYDHMTESDAREMEAAERELWAGLGRAVD